MGNPSRRRIEISKRKSVSKLWYPGVRWLRLLLGLVLLGAGAPVWAQPEGSLWEIGTPITSYYHGPGVGGPRFGSLTPAKAKELAEGGFNMVWVTSSQELDAAHAQGLRAVYYAAGIIDDPAALDDPARRANLEAFIDNVKDHPAMYAYRLDDEPSAAKFPALGRLVAYIRQRDPNHMSLINLFPTYASDVALGTGTSGSTVAAYRKHLRQFVDIVKPDVISYDHYHFLTNGDNSQYFLNLALVREAALKGGIPFINVVQAVTLSPSYRVPNANEGRFLAYTTLAYGGQGLSQFTYYGYSDFEGGVAEYPARDGTLTPLGKALRQINPEFVAVAEQVQPLRSIGAYHVGVQPQGTKRLPRNSPFKVSAKKGILLGLFGPHARLATYALVVNLNYTNSITTTVLGRGDLSVFDATTGLWSPMGSHQVLLNLVPGGGTLVALTSAVPEPETLGLLSLGGDRTRATSTTVADTVCAAGTRRFEE